MRLMVLLSCAFLLGWVLSWMYFVSWTDGDHSISIEQFQSAPDAAATSSQVDAETGFGLDETPAVTPTIAASVNLLAGVRSRLERESSRSVRESSRPRLRPVLLKTKRNQTCTSSSGCCQKLPLDTVCDDDHPV